MTREELQAWADSRETSIEVARGIYKAARGRLASMGRIWEAPNKRMISIVMHTAWELADSEETELFWGEETFRR